MQHKIAVIGLGYVGYPVAEALAGRVDVVGFDIAQARVDRLAAERNPPSRLRLTTRPEDLRGCDFFIVAVPTPIDSRKQPDLTALCAATRTIGSVIACGAIVVYESTVYPGVTEDVCGPLLEEVSGLRRGRDFKLAYSPERINPGDKQHTLERITKVVAAEDEETLETVASVYGTVVEAGIHRAPSIVVAEAAKVIENTQRDLNIALMNELAIIFDRLGIRTGDVLAAAGTKWNFLPFTPGLVGGHCIGVDPYYLTSKAQAVGYHPEVILAGRRINDGMGQYIAHRVVKLMAETGAPLKGARVGVLGLTFKENVADLRNSRVPDIVSELEEFGVSVLVHDAMSDPADARREYGIELQPAGALRGLDALILAVPHATYLSWAPGEFASRLKPGGVLVDVKSVVDAAALDKRCRYWSL